MFGNPDSPSSALLCELLNAPVGNVLPSAIDRWRPVLLPLPGAHGNPTTCYKDDNCRPILLFTHGTSSLLKLIIYGKDPFPRALLLVCGIPTTKSVLGRL